MTSSATTVMPDLMPHSRPECPPGPQPDSEPQHLEACFVWTVPADTWWWSPGCFALHGYRDHEVVPSTTLFLNHRHRDDLYAYVDAVHHAALRGGVVAFEHRVVDVHGRVRPVVLLARSFVSATTEVRAVTGCLLPVEPISADRADDWRLSVIQICLGLGPAAASAVLEWRRRNASETTECLDRIARTMLLSNREAMIRADFEDEFLAGTLFPAAA